MEVPRDLGLDLQSAQLPQGSAEASLRKRQKVTVTQLFSFQV